jgi:hypothetical protein
VGDSEGETVSRRNSGLAQLFDRMCQEYNGRINRVPNLWVFEDQIPKGAERCSFKGKEFRSNDGNGRPMILVRRLAVNCLCPEVGNDYPKSTECDFWHVPYSVCLKCNHRRQPRRGANYSHCAYKKQVKGGAHGAAIESIKMINQANQMAEVLISGKPLATPTGADSGVRE